jgi:F-type H+/Na+-transporting ATPase subunit alpha
MSKTLLDDLIADVENRIDSADMTPERTSSGSVVYLGDGIARIVGLREVAYNEVVSFESGATGVALNLEEHSVGVVVLAGFGTIKE